jgi:WhiB family redox-sensing transcriptional regulator
MKGRLLSTRRSLKEAPLTTTWRLPGPVSELWEWQLAGSCRGENPDIFFHPEHERGPSRRNRDMAAKAVCLTCPVMQQCREHALQVREPYGVWGGLTEPEREAAYLGPTGFPAAS